MVVHLVDTEIPGSRELDETPASATNVAHRGRLSRLHLFKHRGCEIMHCHLPAVAAIAFCTL